MVAATLLFAGAALAQTNGSQSGGQTQAQAGTQGGQEQQANQQQSHQVKGQVVREKEVTVKATGKKNKVVLLKTEDGEYVAVDLGPTEQLEKVQVMTGEPTEARGRAVRIGDRPVLWADELMVGGETVAIERQGDQPQQAQTQTGQQQMDWSQSRQVKGDVVQEKKVKLQNTGNTITAVLLKTENNRYVVVDLGPTEQVRDAKIESGTQLEAQGQIVRVGDRLVLLADQVSVGGETMQIERTQKAGAS
jgi:hypothetical protein